MILTIIRKVLVKSGKAYKGNALSRQLLEHIGIHMLGFTDDELASMISFDQ